MKKIMGVLMTVLMLLGCSLGSALAEDVFTIESAADAAQGAGDESYIASTLTSDRSYLRVCATLEEEASVNISVTDSYGSLTYQRDYGICSGSFRSEDIYLRLDGSETTYQITVSAGESVYTFPVRRVMPRLKGNAACSVGYPLSSLSGAGGWKSATLLDVAALEGSSITVDLHASDAYTLGTVTFSVSGGQLTVSADIDSGIDGSIDGATVYVATTALEAQSLGGKGFTGATGGLNSAISLNGASYAAVYVKFTVSFDPSGVPGSPDVTLPGQDDIWQRMQNETTNEAVG